MSGGTCLNVGCIPTKAMVQSAHAYFEARERFAPLGVRVNSILADFDQVQANRRAIVNGVVSGLDGLMKRVGIQIVHGRGRRGRARCRSGEARRCTSKAL